MFCYRDMTFCRESTCADFSEEKCYRAQMLKGARMTQQNEHDAETRVLFEQIVRRCMFCGEPIAECMGFVLARDFVDQKSQPREVCGKCVLEKADEFLSA